MERLGDLWFVAGRLSWVLLRQVVSRARKTGEFHGKTHHSKRIQRYAALVFL